MAIDTVPRFYFSVCQAGAEKALKAEIAREFPRLRFAFSRPGFVTFKDAEGGKPIAEPLRSVFSRLWGEVLEQAKDEASLRGLFSRIPAGAVVQCFDRDRYTPGAEPPGFERGEKVKSLLRSCSIPVPEGLPRVGETVYDLVWVDDFHVFLGRRERSARTSANPGNAVDPVLPPDAPSRAYLKIEEAIERFQPDLKPGMSVLEVGCAPGGASSALLARGLSVVGVDPQYMAGAVFAHPRFRSIRKETRHLLPEDLRGANPDWLVMDMSIAPLEALDQLSYAVGLLKELRGAELRLRGGFLTLKLNDRRFASSIPLYLKRIGEIGFRDLVPTQLCANRQEFFVFAPRFA